MTFLRGLAAAVCTLAMLAPVAQADVTVNLRVEGSDRTLFEGPITTDARTIDARDQDGNDGSFPCNYRDNGNSGASSQGTPTTAVYDAMRRSGQAFEATWYDSFDDFSVDRLGGDVAGSPDYWGVAVDGQEAQVGGCQVRLDDGDEVLWAYGLFGRPILQLTGPETVQVGQQAIFRVTDSRTGNGVGDALVAGRATNSDGRVEITWTDTGEKTVKAERSGAIRSNAREIEVVPSAPGTAPVAGGLAGSTATGTGGPDRTAPRASIASMKRGQVFSRTRAPKLLRGKVADETGLLMVKLRITRTDRGRCTAYSGKRERWIRRPKCGAEQGWWFKIGSEPDWEYQLARKLPRGRYVLDVKAVDKAFNRDDQRRPGENRVVFHVR